MKTKLLLILSLFLLVSCNKKLVQTKNEATKNEVVQNDVVISETNKKDENAVKQELNTTTEEEVTTIRTTEYDTDKPKDSVTGTHPVKRITEQTTTKGKISQFELKEQVKKQEELIKETEDKSKSNINTNINTETKETKMKSDIQYIWYIVGSVLLFGLVVLILIYRKKIKAIFKCLL